MNFRLNFRRWRVLRSCMFAKTSTVIKTMISALLGYTALVWLLLGLAIAGNIASAVYFAAVVLCSIGIMALFYSIHVSAEKARRKMFFRL